LADFDFFVIGAGSGGVRAARIAASHGARVGIAEDRYYGGTCVNVGCVPKKLMAIGAHYSADLEDAAGFGWTVGARTHDWATLIRNKDAEIARLNGIYRRLLEGAGVETFDARARLAGPGRVEVAGRTVTADHILVATGSHPEWPDHPGAREHGMISDAVFHLPEMPRRIAIVGAGYIGVEFAGIFHGLGAEVTLIHRGDGVLRGFDEDVRSHLAAEMSKAGVAFRFEVEVDRVERLPHGVVLTLTDGTTLVADAVLFATGRKPNTAGLGLEEAGVALDRNGAIVVDERHESTAARIYAIGDVTHRLNLTPVATAEGHALADRLFAGRERLARFDLVPTAVFSHPPVGTVGLTEAEARGRGLAVDIYRASFRPIRHTMSGRDARTLMKLVVDAETDRVLGLHMVGEDAPEITQGFAVALVAGATKAQFDATIGIHPTAAEEFVTMRTKA
jgi:glutathione reductase (NADPH)